MVFDSHHWHLGRRLPCGPLWVNCRMFDLPPWRSREGLWDSDPGGMLARAIAEANAKHTLEQWMLQMVVEYPRPMCLAGSICDLDFVAHSQSSQRCRLADDSCLEGNADGSFSEVSSVSDVSKWIFLIWVTWPLSKLRLGYIVHTIWLCRDTKKGNEVRPSCAHTCTHIYS